MMQRTILILILVLAFSLRIWLSSVKEFSFDEYFTVTLGLGIQDIQSHFNVATAAMAKSWIQSFYQLKQLANLAQFSVFLEDLNPPAYFIITGLWMLLTSLDKFWLRLPNILLSLLSLLLIFRVSTRFSTQEMAGFITFVMAFSSIHLFYASLARPYIAIVFLALLATELLLSKRWKLYTLCSTLGVLTHLFYLPIFLTHGTYLFLTQENRAYHLKRWGLMLVLPLFVLLGWMLTILSQQLSDQQDNSIFTGLPFLKLLWHHSILSRWLFYCDKPLPHWSEYPLDFITSAGIWLILLIEAYRTCIKKTGAFLQANTRPYFILGLCWFFLPLCIITAFDVIMHSRLSGTERYLYILSPGILFIMGAILSTWPLLVRRLSLGILAALIMLNTSLFLQYRGLPTENYQGLAERIQPELKPDDLVLVITGYPSIPALGHYLPPHTMMASVGDLSSNDSEALINPKRLTQLSQGHPTIWLIATYGQLASLQPIEEVIHILEQQGYRLTQTLEMNNIRLGGYRLSRRQ